MGTTRRSEGNGAEEIHGNGIARGGGMGGLSGLEPRHGPADLAMMNAGSGLDSSARHHHQRAQEALRASWVGGQWFRIIELLREVPLAVRAGVGIAGYGS